MNATQVQLKDSTQELIADLVENNYCEDDIYNFIEQYGEDALENCYEDYCECGDSYSYEAVDAFCSEFGVENLGIFEDAYYGEYETPEIFVENYVNDTESIHVPDYLVIDFEATWNSSFRDDFSFVEGFIFNRNF